MRKALLRSTPARITVVLGAAFFVSLALSAAIAFVLIRQELTARVDRTIEDTYAIIAESFGESDVTDLTESVTNHASASIEDDRVYLLRDQSGRRLAGNLDFTPPRDGWLTVPASALAAAEGGSDYRFFSGRVNNYDLTVGMSLSEADEVGALILTVVGWAGAGFVLVVLATGIVVAARGQKRLDQISDTMGRLGRGELQARIPISGRADDIDALGTTVNAALDRLAALVEGMRQVSVDIAHELKTPLNRLGIALEATIEANGRGEPVAPALDLVQAEARQINATFDALLRIAQIESGARRARFTNLNLAAILETIAEVYGPVAAEAGHKLVLEMPGPLAPLLGDADLLTQLVANLVENAIRHCPAGAEIVLKATSPAGGVELTIADTGPGIPAGEREPVFQRLYRLDKSRTTTGSGLGLSLVRAIADLHGAAVSLRDNEPGLVVTIRFPHATPGA